MDSDKYYCYTNPCFGLATAPKLFQDFSSAVGELIETLTGFRVYVYLDDFIIQVSPDVNISDDELKSRVQGVIDIFTTLGLRINKKSDVTPATEILWLGRFINTSLGMD